MSVLKARRLSSTPKSPEFIAFCLEFGCPSCRVKLGRDALRLDANTAARPTLFVSQVAANAIPDLQELQNLQAEIEALANQRQAELDEQTFLAPRVAADVASQAVANAAARQLAARAEPPGPELAERAEHAAEQAEQAAEDAEPAAERAEPAAQDAKAAAEDAFQPDWGEAPAAAAPAVPQAGELPAAAEAGNASPAWQAGVMPAAAEANAGTDEGAEQGQGKGWQRDDWMERDGRDWTQVDAQKGWQGQQERAQQQGARNDGWDNWSRPEPAQSSAAAASQGSWQGSSLNAEPPRRSIYSTSAAAAPLVAKYPEHQVTLESGGLDASALRARGLNASNCMLRDIDHIAQVLWFLSNLHHDLVPKILLEPQLRQLLESSEPADLRQKFANKSQDQKMRNPSAWIQASVHDAADHADGGRSWPGEQERPPKRRGAWRNYG